MSRKALITVVPMFVLLIGAFLWLRPNQATFYSDETLLERAAQARDKALAGTPCDELKLVATMDAPAGAVRIFVWNCLSRASESREVIVRVLNDGETQAVSNRLECRNDEDARNRGFLCASA